MIQNGNSLLTGNTTAGGDDFNLGGVANAFGSYTLSGSTLTATHMNVGQNGYGIMNLLSGGSINLSNDYGFLAGRSATGLGVVNIAGGTATIGAGGGTRTGVYGGGRLEFNMGVNLGGSNVGGVVRHGREPSRTRSTT